MSEKIKQEIKETVTKLANANLDFTIEDELEFAKVAVKSAEQKLERAELENKRLLEIINAKPLETVDMDCAFEIEKLKEQLQAKEQECKKLRNEKVEIKKYLGISSKTIMQRLEELQEYKDEMKVREDNYKQALEEIEEFCVVYSNDHDAYETVYKHILDIINKAKDNIND